MITDELIAGDRGNGIGIFGDIYIRPVEWQPHLLEAVMPTFTRLIIGTARRGDGAGIKQLVKMAISEARKTNGTRHKFRKGANPPANVYFGSRTIYSGR